MKTTPVIFRKHFDRDAKRWEVTAFFPELPGSTQGPAYLTCYAHIGQHGAAHPDMLRTGKPALPGEYADLLAELRGIYETDDDPIKLVLRQRESPTMRHVREWSYMTSKGLKL